MHKDTVLKKDTANKLELLDLIIDSIQDIKGKNIVKLDMRELDDAPTDYFVICEGDSSTQISSISDNIVKKVKEVFGIKPSHIEGKLHSTWVLVDYFDVIVHVFYPETRRFYEIEELWSDAKTTEYQNI
ncbi:MAG: ribosome silencing factor [Saprospiraceae bacterium]|nr:ribosome silencing factor [Bacteroidia bacterium]MBT8230395.1 ribosome silencing factor [Bacteroidia bacterium]NNF20512.1 ribosome silencing factor [Saprospiraceae bacterium]NNK89456.1 ribosome silencing factor [Saprospiraceae bacterium]